MDPADYVFDFDAELLSLDYSLRCLYAVWSGTLTSREKEAVLKRAQMEVDNVPWLWSSLPEFLRVFTSSPECQLQASNPFSGSRLALGGPRSLQRVSRRRKARIPAVAPAAMVPASVPVQHAISLQGNLLGQHEQMMRALAESNQSLALHMSNLAAQVSTLTSSAAFPASSNPPVDSTPCRDFSIADPEPFHGEVEKCRGFLFQCNKVFRQRPVSFSSDGTKINYMLSLLRGRALTWAEALSYSVDYNTLSFGVFSDHFSFVFDHPEHSGSAATRLLNLQQGTRTVADYSIEFRTLAAEARWDEAALRAVFVRGLKDQLKDEL